VAIGFLFDMPGITQQQYDTVMRELRLNEPDAAWPPSMICHVAGPIEGGWRVVDVWESQEAAETFFRERLAQAAQKVGIAPPHPSVFPVHKLHTP
jgi:hypothetical protein